MPLTYHPDFYAAVKPMLPAMAARIKPPRHDIETRRTSLSLLMAPLSHALPTPPDVTTSVHTVKSFDGYEVVVYQYSKIGAEPGPAILAIHGGGLIAGNVPMFEKVLLGRAAESGIQIFSVEYRLAPEHPFPAPLEDCYAALLWLQQSAPQFGIDPTRIAIMGESAGGCLTAGLAIMARDKGFSPPIKKQILVYPMLDDRNITPNPAVEAHAVWTTEDNITGWSAYLGTDVTKRDASSPVPSSWAVPARVDSVEGLPPAYIDVGTLDIFRDEDLKYATRLVQAGIDVEFHLYHGVPHAFEALAPQSLPVKTALTNRMNAIMGI